MKTTNTIGGICGVMCLCALSIHAPAAFAMSGTSQVAWSGQPVAGVAGWPEGTLALINDPLRTDGWNPWFSECSNDVNFYAYKIHDTDDVNRLLKSLAGIKTTQATLRLNPGKQAAALGFSTVLPKTNQTAAVFSVGNQRLLDEWYRRLPVVKPGVRMFGVNQYTNTPVAAPPALMIYVGHKTIDLQKLQIPDTVTVVADVEAAKNGTEATVKVIEAFMSARQAKSLIPGSGAN
jgi:hypothetical protein